MRELRFLLEQVLKVNVLGHSQTLARFSLDEVFTELSLVKNRLKDPNIHSKETYPELFSPTIFGFSLPKKYGGKGMAESLGLLFFAEVAEVNAQFGFELLQSLACFNLLSQHNEDGKFDELLESMIKGEVQGVMELIEAGPSIVGTEPSLELIQKDGQQYLTGKKTLFFTPSKIDKKFILTAKGEEGLQLFLVDEQGLKINQLHEDHYLSPVEVEVGDLADIELICTLNEDYFKTSLMRKYLTLLAYSLIDQSYKRALSHARKTNIENSWKKEESVNLEPMISHPKIVDSLMTMKCYRDGLRAMIFHSIFYHDCANYGAEDRRGYFQNLSHLFGIIFKYYTPRKVELVKNQAGHILGPEHFSHQDQNLLFHIDLLAGNPLNLVTRLVCQDLPANEGELIKDLLQEFGEVQLASPKTEELTEAINIWKDYIGGLFLLNDEISGTERPRDNVQSLLTSEKVAELLGDVIMAYLLIKEAMEAEKSMEEIGVNFYNLANEISQDPEVASRYNRIVSASYFCQSVLSLQDSKIQLIQKSHLTPMSANLTED